MIKNEQNNSTILLKWIKPVGRRRDDTCALWRKGITRSRPSFIVRTTDLFLVSQEERFTFSFIIFGRRLAPNL